MPKLNLRTVLKIFAIFCVIFTLGIASVKLVTTSVKDAKDTKTQVQTKLPTTKPTAATNLPGQAMLQTQAKTRILPPVMSQAHIKSLCPKKPVYQDANMCLFFDKIAGDYVLVAIPRILNSPATPVVVYVRGQTEVISPHVLRFDANALQQNHKLASKLKTWAKIYTSHGYIFIAPNLFMGPSIPQKNTNQQAKALQQVVNSVIKSYAPATRRVSLVAFSLGSRPAALFARQNPDKVNHVKFLAPTTLTDYYLQCGAILPKHQIYVTIYHGKKDVNISYSVGRNFYNTCMQKISKTTQKAAQLVKFHTLPNDTHWTLGYTNSTNILLPNIPYSRGMLQPHN